MFRRIKEPTKESAQDINEAVKDAIVTPWSKYDNPGSGGRPHFWTANLEKLQKGRNKVYKAWRQGGISAAKEDHERLSLAFKPMVRGEKRRVASKTT